MKVTKGGGCKEQSCQSRKCWSHLLGPWLRVASGLGYFSGQRGPILTRISSEDCDKGGKAGREVLLQFNNFRDISFLYGDLWCLLGDLLFHETTQAFDNTR